MELIFIIIIIVVIISSNKKKTEQSSEKQHSSYEKSKTYSYDNKNVSAVNNNVAQTPKKPYGHGSARTGERLVEGDVVPRGMIKVDCSYCGAENLIQPRDRGNCVCYFCRTKL